MDLLATLRIQDNDPPQSAHIQFLPMKIDLEGLDVYFPYEYIYPEQLAYMGHLKHALDQQHGGHCLLEMPTGTGKTVSLLSLVCSYQHRLRHDPDMEGPTKLVYCTRTVQEMDKVMEELARVLAYLDTHSGAKQSTLSVCLSSRRNMCIHPTVSSFDNREQVDALCRDLTAPWVRDDPSKDHCGFYDSFQRDTEDSPPEFSGVFSLDDMKRVSGERGWCPYFTVRALVSRADIIVYNYQYMLDPKISSIVSKQIDGTHTVVVFDEAHNIDSICIESLSVILTRRTLNAATGNLASLTRSVSHAQSDTVERLRAEYQRLVSGLVVEDGAGMLQGDPVLDDDLIRESMPGHIRKANHFLTFISAVLQYLKVVLGGRSITEESPDEFIRKFQNDANMRDFQTKALKFAHDRLQSLLRTLQVTHLDEFTPLQIVCNFLSLVSTYSRGFVVLLEPWNDRLPGIPDPVLQLACLDASIAIKPVIERYRNIIITSGTLSPIDLYPKLLNFNSRIMESLSMSVSSREIICPIIVTHGNDQVELTSRFEKRSDPAVLSNYGRLVLDMATTVPDGIVVFFPSYSYMEAVLTWWSSSGVLGEIAKKKLVFIETQDIVETSLALDSFKKSCDCGRGAVFFSIARGKVAEGIDFDRHYGRCVIIIGIPFQYSLSRVLRARLRYLNDVHQIQEKEFLSFDALRQASQCVGRVIRSKLDYGIVVLADNRFKRVDKYKKLPGWIKQHLTPGRMSCSIEQAVSISKTFLRDMGQPHSQEDEVGVTLLDSNKVAELFAANMHSQ